MDPIFTEEQLNRMSRDDMLSLVKIMQGHYQKQKEALEKQETRIQLLEEKTKELEFLNAMLSDRLTLAQRKRFGASSEKYADGYTQLNLFNEAEQEADPNAPEPDLEEVHPSSYKRKKRSGKKEEDLSSFETTEVIEYKLAGADRYCPDCNTKYKVVTKETVKRLKFVPARFEVVEEVTFVYSCPKCGAMKREGVKFSVSMGKIFFDKNQICIIVLSKFLVFCCRIIYLIIVLPIRLRLYMNFIIFCSTNNGISNPFSWALPTPGLGNKLGFSGNTINAEGIR